MCKTQLTTTSEALFAAKTGCEWGQVSAFSRLALCKTALTFVADELVETKRSTLCQTTSNDKLPRIRVYERAFRRT